MESMFSENGLYIGLAVVGSLLLFFAFLQAWLLKLAVRICGGDDIGVMYGLAVISSYVTASIVVTAGFVFLLPDQKPTMAMLCSFLAIILVMCVMLQMGPIRAFGVYLVHGVMSGVSAFALLLLLLVGAKFAIPSEKLEAFATDLKARIESQEQFASAMDRTDVADQETANLDSVNEWLNGGEAQDMADGNGEQPVTKVDFSALDQLQSLLGNGGRSLGGQAGIGEESAPTTPARRPVPPPTGTIRTNPFTDN